MAGTKTLITVVDDDLSISRMLSRVLMSEGFEVESYASAEDFLKSGLLNDSECLILDINLPGMTGVELQQQLLEKGSNVVYERQGYRNLSYISLGMCPPINAQVLALLRGWE